jgi:hypothetical protein
VVLLPNIEQLPDGGPIAGRFGEQAEPEDESQRLVREPGGRQMQEFQGGRVGQVNVVDGQELGRARTRLLQQDIGEAP